MSDGPDHGWTERLLYRLAFAAGPALTAAGEMESTLYAGRLGAIELERPLFITGLPRAGTTILLNLLVHSGRYASHTYRDLPFVLCPLLWQRLSGPFQRGATSHERLHGDGLAVSADSPEAFDEMVWRAFFPEHYRHDRILPWAFMRNHARKVIALRGGGRAMRYVSKNNLNIARLAALPEVFDDGLLVIPFRDPVQHAASLLAQHQRFLALHRADRFSRIYMAGIGHHDFGANFLPVDFDGWLAQEPPGPPTGLAFWLAYWCAAYRHALDHAGDHVRLLSYDAFTADPARGLAWLAALAGLDDASVLASAPDGLHPPRRHAVDTASVAPELLASAAAVHAELLQRSELGRG
jgi:hypothetical protein